MENYYAIVFLALQGPLGNNNHHIRSAQGAEWPHIVGNRKTTATKRASLVGLRLPGQIFLAIAREKAHRSGASSSTNR